MDVWDMEAIPEGNKAYNTGGEGTSVENDETLPCCEKKKVFLSRTMSIQDCLRLNVVLEVFSFPSGS